ncbi:hypothetical protein VVD49_05055 [Uliginosibacterium sp. H3]|uniref:Uncharacterized protein n=1 Tax=Uliginosibacterium silvisoli TaxID=3114758 RepID=A0ABU6K213_9RHOO|nr:hypothetical protein [Uliginosibacterium sp. H3]
MNTTEPQSPPMREVLGNALCYWEPRRLIYNSVLLLVVAGAFAAGWPVSKRALHTDFLLVIFILAVLANVVYCAAYLPDIVVQQSSMREAWLRWRWVLLLVGILFASAITYLCVAGVFGLVDGNW